MKSLNSRELHSTVDRALAEVERRLASGELDQSGRYYSDAEVLKLVIRSKSKTARVRRSSRPAAASARSTSSR